MQCEPAERTEISEIVTELTVIHKIIKRCKIKFMLIIFLICIPGSIIIGEVISRLALISINFEINNKNDYTFAEYISISLDNWLNQKIVIKRSETDPPIVNVHPAKVRLMSATNKLKVFYKIEGSYVNIYNPNKNTDALLKTGNNDLVSIPYSSEGKPTIIEKEAYRLPKCLNCELQEVK